jgi:hypothetical protein
MRYGVFVIRQAAPETSWMNDGDQDGDRWEGTEKEAEAQARRLRELEPNLQVLVLPAPKQ